MFSIKSTEKSVGRNVHHYSIKETSLHLAYISKVIVYDYFPYITDQGGKQCPDLYALYIYDIFFK